MPTKNNVIFNGREYELCDSLATLGESIPDFQVLLFNKGDSEGIVIKKEDLVNHDCPILISVTTSIDTPIGSIQTKKFNELLSPFSSRALLWSVSSDLPFNINRFFNAEGIETLSGASDYLYNSFGKNFGVMVEEVRLLVRAVFVIDRLGVLRYCQIPQIIQTELDYDMAINVLNELVNEDNIRDIGEQESTE